MAGKWSKGVGEQAQGHDLPEVFSIGHNLNGEIEEEFGKKVGIFVFFD